MQKPVQLVFHLIAASVLGFGIYYDVCKVRIPEDIKRQMVEYGGRWKYLTFWNLVLQCVYFSFRTLNDIGNRFLGRKQASKAQGVLDYIFGALVNPLGLFVASIFWGLWMIDRELVFPAVLDTFFPSWLNHVMHTSIVPFDLIELTLIPTMFPSRRNALYGLFTLMSSYLVWIFIVAYKTDFWVYPVLAVLHWGYRLLFIFALVCYSSVLYLVGEKLHSRCWGKCPDKQLTQTKEAKKKPKLDERKQK